MNPFEVLCGFRGAAEAAALLRQLAVPDLAAVISCLDLADEGLGVRRATALLLELRNRGADNWSGGVGAQGSSLFPVMKSGELAEQLQCLGH